MVHQYKKIMKLIPSISVSIVLLTGSLFFASTANAEPSTQTH